MVHIVERKLELQASKEALFAWHARLGAFERLSVPWRKMKILERHGTIKDGDGIQLKVWIGPVGIPLQFEHYGFVEGMRFGDRQVSGPFKSYQHEHHFYVLGVNRSSLVDHIEYDPPVDIMQGWVEKELERIFTYRHTITRHDVEYHQQHSKRSLKILIAGGSGTVGAALVPFLTAGGHDVHLLQRHDPKQRLYWNPDKGILQESLEDFDAVVNLAGYPIAQGRWNETRKQKIAQSRYQATKLLVDSMQKLKKPPQVFVSASGIGYYGNCGNTEIDETQTAGSGFLADVCREWEKEANRATSFGCRVVNARIGVVLTPKGGALAKMLPAFRLGLGGRLGSGKQCVSWIGIDDLIALMHYAMVTPELAGPVNCVAPNPVTNKEFTETLASILHRPAFLPVPATLLRVALGELADDALLASVNVHSKKLQSSGYRFSFQTLEQTLCHLLGVHLDHQKS